MQSDYHVTLTDEAISDIESIVCYYMALGLLSAAEKVEKTIKDSICSLGVLPHRIPFVDSDILANRGLRCMVSGKYLIYFFILENTKEVVVVAILPAKRDRERLLQEKGL